MSDSTNSGGSTLGLLGVLFIGLKLTGFIDWSWLWVLAPFWGALAVIVAGFIGFLIFYVTVGPIADFVRGPVANFVGPYWKALREKIEG